jgi:5'-3' exonuclease
MGVKGLYKYLETKHPQCVRYVDLENLSGCSLAIDASVWLYISMYKVTEESNRNHVTYFFNHIIELFQNNIVPIFVFDGKAPEAKELVLKQREKRKRELQTKIADAKEHAAKKICTEGEKEAKKAVEKIESQLINIQPHHSEDVLKLVKSLGIQCIRANGEADHVCAWLSRNGLVDAVMTEDIDLLVGGATTMLKRNRNISKSVLPWTLVTLRDVLDCTRLSYEQFVDTVLLMGCDYIEGINKMGPVSSVAMVKKYGTLKRVCTVECNSYLIPEDYIERADKCKNLFTGNVGEVDFTPIPITSKGINWDSVSDLLHASPWSSTKIDSKIMEFKNVLNGML